MRRPLFLLFLPAALAVGAPAPPTAGPSAATDLRQAEAEFKAARDRARALERASDRAAGSLEKLRAEQAASAGAIEEAEARITLAERRLVAARAGVATARARLAEARQPAAALIAGLALMGRRPPLLALADADAADALVHGRILLDSTLPAVRARSAAFASEVARADAMLAKSSAAARELRDSRLELVAKQAQFADSERNLLAALERHGAAAIVAGDEAIAAGESLAGLRRESRRQDAARGSFAQLAAGSAIPARPGSADGALLRAPFAYRLPASADVSEGLGAISDSGVRARGVTLATQRGALVEAPAAGTVRFAGPFQGFDGVLIIDHGNGWLSLLVNVAAGVKRGQRVEIGEPVGRALGPLSVELSRNGKRSSPALIAGSSPPLSKGGKGR